MKKILVHVTQSQYDFLKLIIHTDAASSIGGEKGELGNSVQWCIDACMAIEKRYKEHGIDACYIGFHGSPIEEDLKFVVCYPDTNKPIAAFDNLKLAEEWRDKYSATSIVLNSGQEQERCVANVAQ